MFLNHPLPGLVHIPMRLVNYKSAFHIWAVLCEKSLRPNKKNYVFPVTTDPKKIELVGREKYNFIEKKIK